MPTETPDHLRKRTLALLRVLEEAIQAGRLRVIETDVGLEVNARTGDNTGRQTVTITTQPK